MTSCRASSHRAMNPTSREIGERLVQMPDELRKVDRVVGRQLELVVVGAVHLGHDSGVVELVANATAGESHGVGLDRLGHHLRHQRDDEAGVQASGEHRSERHVAHQPEPHRFDATRRAARRTSRPPSVRSAAKAPGTATTPRSACPPSPPRSDGREPACERPSRGVAGPGKVPSMRYASIAA